MPQWKIFQEFTSLLEVYVPQLQDTNVSISMFIHHGNIAWGGYYPVAFLLKKYITAQTSTFETSIYTSSQNLYCWWKVFCKQSDIT